MAIFPRPAKPSTAWADLKAFLRGQERHKILIAIISIMMPAIIVLGFYVDSNPGKQRAQVIYAQSWPASRTDAEIEKQNIADQKILDAKRRARQAEFQRLADKLGIE